VVTVQGRHGDPAFLDPQYLREIDGVLDDIDLLP
jgi:hypothetical protein